MTNEIEKACNILDEGGVVGMPTETVYGLAASIKSENGIKKIFAIKERPFFDPLIVHVSGIEMAKDLVASWPETAEILVRNFWPGPLTIVLPKNNNISDLITSGLDSVGLRCPNHPVALELIQKMGHGLAAPSANKFTKTSPTTSSHVKDEFSDEVLVLEGGACQIGIESTVVGIENNVIKIYRPGDITRQDILDAFNGDVSVEYTSSPVAPGQLEHHYMPKAPVILACDREISELDGKLDGKLTANPVFWSLPKEPSLAARQLYSKFRELSKENPSCIVLILDKAYIQDENWRGILNRVTKASSYNLLTKDHPNNTEVLDEKN